MSKNWLTWEKLCALDKFGNETTYQFANRVITSTMAGESLLLLSDRAFDRNEIASHYCYPSSDTLDTILENLAKDLVASSRFPK